MMYLNSHLSRIREDCKNHKIASNIIEDHRHAFKMIIFLVTFFLRNTCIKRGKEENIEAA